MTANHHDCDAHVEGAWDLAGIYMAEYETIIQEKDRNLAERDKKIADQAATIQAIIGLYEQERLQHTLTKKAQALRLPEAMWHRPVIPSLYDEKAD